MVKKLNSSADSPARSPMLLKGSGGMFILLMVAYILVTAAMAVASAAKVVSSVSKFFGKPASVNFLQDVQISRPASIVKEILNFMMIF